MKTMDIVYATDENYCRYMAVSMYSVMKSATAGEKFCFHVLTDALSLEARARLEHLCARFGAGLKIRPVTMSRYADLSAGGKHITNVTYFRFEIAEQLPDLDRALYLDCDTLVCGSLSELFDFDLGRDLCAAVEDLGFALYNRLVENYASARDVHFNAGVLLLNLRQWRLDGLGRRLYDFARQNASSLTLADQEVINEVCRGAIRRFPSCFNVQDAHFHSEAMRTEGLALEENLQAALHPVIRHYSSPEKPWGNHSVPNAADWLNAYLEVFGDMKDPLALSARHFLYPNLTRCLLRALRYGYCIVMARLLAKQHFKYERKARAVYGR